MRNQDRQDRQDRIVIATTEGPAEVERLSEEDPDVRSVVCLQGKALALPISPDYDAFVRRPVGVIEARFGHACYRLDVSAPISGGLSWQLGVFAAHALKAAGRLAEKGGKAGKIFWLSGEMDHDLKVLPVAHVAAKLQAAKSFFEAQASQLILPAGNRTLEVMALIDQMGLEGRGCEVLWVENARDLMAALGLSRPAEVPVAPRAGRRRTAAGLALLLLGSVTAFTHLPAQEIAEAFPAIPTATALPKAEATPAPEKPRLRLVALETRVAPEGNCAEVTLGRVAAENREVPLPGSERQISRQLERLCGLSYQAVNSGPAAEIWLIAARAGGNAARLHAKVFASALPLGAGESATFEVKLPRRFDDALEHLFLLVARPPGGEPLPPLPDARPTRDAWNDWVSALEDRGFAPTAAAHLLSPEEAFF